MNFGLKQSTHLAAALVALLALAPSGWAQTPSPAAPPTVAAPSAQIDRSLRCEDSKSVALAREESRHQQVLQRLVYQEQRNAESIRRMRFSCSRRSPQSVAACEARAAGSERQYGEKLDVARAREDAYNTEMLRRIDAYAQVCASRYGGGGMLPTPIAPSVPIYETPEPIVPPVQAAPVTTVPTSPAVSVPKPNPVEKVAGAVATGSRAITVIQGVLGIFGRKQ